MMADYLVLLGCIEGGGELPLLIGGCVEGGGELWGRTTRGATSGWLGTALHIVVGIPTVRLFHATTVLPDMKKSK